MPAVRGHMASGMDLRTKMGSIVMLAAGAVLGACVAVYFTRRRKGRGPNDTKDDTNLRLREEIAKSRRQLEDLSQRLEEEGDRRRESENWGRMLEKDLHDHVTSEKVAEEKIEGLRREVEELEKRAQNAEDQNKELTRQLKQLQACTEPDTPAMLPECEPVSAVGTTPGTEGGRQPTHPHPTHPHPTPQEGTGDQPEHAHCLRVNTQAGITTPRLYEDYDEDYDEDNEEDYDDYTDEDEDYEDEEEDGERQLDLIKQSILPSPTSEENFELGKDVMGALIEKAFKGGMLESRDRDGNEAGQRTMRAARENASMKSGTSPDRAGTQGEVSQESIGDIKSTRRFWEQMIASDLPEEDDVSDDDVTDEGDDDEYESDYDVRETKSNEDTLRNNPGEDGGLGKDNHAPAATNGLAQETLGRLNCEPDQSAAITTMTSQNDLKTGHYQTLST